MPSSNAAILLLVPRPATVDAARAMMGLRVATFYPGYAEQPADVPAQGALFEATIDEVTAADEFAAPGPGFAAAGFGPAIDFEIGQGTIWFLLR